MWRDQNLFGVGKGEGGMGNGEREQLEPLPLTFSRKETTPLLTP